MPLSTWKTICVCLRFITFLLNQILCGPTGTLVHSIKPTTLGRAFIDIPTTTERCFLTSSKSMWTSLKVKRAFLFLKRITLSWLKSNVEDILHKTASVILQLLCVPPLSSNFQMSLSKVDNYIEIVILSLKAQELNHGVKVTRIMTQLRINIQAFQTSTLDYFEIRLILLTFYVMFKWHTVFCAF